MTGTCHRYSSTRPEGRFDDEMADYQRWHEYHFGHTLYDLLTRRHPHCLDECGSFTEVARIAKDRFDMREIVTEHCQCHAYTKTVDITVLLHEEQYFCTKTGPISKSTELASGTTAEAVASAPAGTYLG